jgi:hypothetical protein
MGHDHETRRVHYYNADASVLGGRIERPFEQLIPIQAPSSLSPVGGYGVARAESFRLQGIMSFESGYTQVAGSSTATGPYSTMVTAVVEGLNVLNIFTADRVVSQISLDHPREGYIPRVSLVGTQYENVRIAGRPVEIVLDLDFCSQGDGEEFPRQPCVRDPRFLARVQEQRQRMMDGRGSPERTADQTVPKWVGERYEWGNSKAERGKDGVLCSVVKEIRGQFPGRVFGNAFEIPEFGKGFLGELLVDCSSFQLIMVRLELGCATKGTVALAASHGNGSTDP